MQFHRLGWFWVGWKLDFQLVDATVDGSEILNNHLGWC